MYFNNYINKKESAPAVSKKAHWIQFFVMAGVGLFFFFLFEYRIMAFILWGISSLLLSGLIFFEIVLKGFAKTGSILARGIGGALTWILLAPLFYIVFGLGRLFLNIRGIDPMNRHPDPGTGSYWSPYRSIDIQTRYHRQF